MFEIFVFSLILVLSPLAQIVAGELIAEHGFTFVLPKLKHSEAHPRTYYWLGYYVLGLLTYLALVLGLSVLGCPLRAASVLAFGPALFRPKRFLDWLRQISFPLSANFLLWLTVCLILGCSLFSSVEGIQTAWRNNYGDLAWHMGMITSFVFGHNLPPQNHLFAGEVLSYPFFINLWTATLWVHLPSFRTLDLIFVYQWMLLWSAVYFALRGSVYRMLPWVALFGGGAYETVWRFYGADPAPALDGAGPYAHDLITRGYPWTPFLTTIWVTQRPALLGLSALLVAAMYFHGALSRASTEDLAPDESEHEQFKSIFLAGAILSFSVLAHTHFFLVGVLYMVMMLALDAFKRRRELDRHALRLIGLLLLALVPAILFLPWIIGKSHISSIAGGWMQDDVYKTLGFVPAAVAGVGLWMRNDPFWLLSLGLLAGLSRSWRFLITMIVLFIVGNVVQLAIWNWDQMKFFLALYLLSLSMWSISDAAAQRRCHWLLVLLIVPCLYEIVVNLRRYEQFTVYSKEDLSRAEEIRRVTPPGVVIAAAPNHNSAITLTGRKMFFGYEGTLGSHGIDFQPRKAIFESLDKLLECGKERTEGKPVCPDYLFWTDAEQRFWSRQKPGEKAIGTELNFLYRLKPDVPDGHS
ncbi:MAG: hypothetical protein U0136_05115 [Bdellovibrionota bacterium]